MHSSIPNANEPTMDYRHASISVTPLTPRAAPASSTPVVGTVFPSKQSSRHQPRQQPTAPAVSQIVNITLPSSISAKAALQMVQTTVKTLMYMRGLLSSPWDQLEMLVKMDQQEQEEQEQEEQDLDHTETLGTRSTPSRSIMRNPSPMKPLQEFLEAGDKMFTTLEEAVYDQLYQQLKKARAPSLPRTAFSDTTTASTDPMPSSPPHQPVILSLALIFGTTLSTPKEQYMIHLGPLTPQLSLLSTTTSALSASVFNDQAKDEDETNHESDEALRNQLHRMERQWERRLVQGLMGIRIVDDSTSTSAQDPQQQQQQANFLETGASTLPKTKVLLLMKAKSGQIIDGMLPKLALDLQEDFELEFSSTSAPSSSSSAAATTTRTTEKPAQKTKRWPIHHIRVMGPRPKTMPDSGQEDNNIWYQVGPGLPTMPNLK